MEAFNSSKYWKWGIFYYNPDDKRIFPAKRNPILGWTEFRQLEVCSCICCNYVIFWIVYFIDKEVRPLFFNNNFLVVRF